MKRYLCNDWRVRECVCVRDGSHLEKTQQNGSCALCALSSKKQKTREAHRLSSCYDKCEFTEEKLLLSSAE